MLSNSAYNIALFINQQIFRNMKQNAFLLLLFSNKAANSHLLNFGRECKQNSLTANVDVIFCY